ncbi:MAG: PAS domain S-box protein [Verrucomicrobiota bacterium]
MKPEPRRNGNPRASAKKRPAKPRPLLATTSPGKPSTADRASAGRSSELMEKMLEQHSQLELQNEQLSETREELEYSHHRYADLYDLAPVGYMTLDGKGCIQEINQTASQMLGWSVAHLMGRPLLPHIAAGDRRFFLKHLWESRRSTTQVITTLRLHARDGEERSVQLATSCSRDLGNRPNWCRTALIDITRQRLAEAALSASEAKFRVLAENIGELFWFMELDPPRITYVSPAFERIMGIPVEELYRDCTIWEKCVHPDDLPASRAAFYRWVEGETDEFNIDYRVINRQGEVRWLSDRGTILNRKDGRPYLVSGIARDITDRKNAEQKFRGLLEAAPEAMIIVDDASLIQLVNAKTLRIFGYTRDELIGQPLELLIPERVRHQHARLCADYIAAPISRSMAEDKELFALRKDGSEIPVQVSLSPLETAEGLLIITAVRDITERRQAEQALRAAQQLAESTLEAVPASLAVLDANGTIVSTNRSWNEFAEANGALPEATGVGTNYLALCAAAEAEGIAEAAQFAKGIREVMSGVRNRFSMEYPCHSPEQQRWFVGYVTACLGIGPNSVVVAHVDISERKHAELCIQKLNAELEHRVDQRTKALRSANKELRHQIIRRRRLEEEILEISEREQQRIGRDLHDDLGQQLAAASMMSAVHVRKLVKQGSPEAEAAQRITELLKESLTLTRGLARGLHPVPPEPGGLRSALQGLAVRASETFHINCQFKCPVDLQVDNNTMATHLYRIAQEAVSNGVRHGHASRIEIEISADPHAIVLSIKDNGKGFPAVETERKGMGLRIMSYRSDMIGGELGIRRNPIGQGTIVSCTVHPATGSDRSGECPDAIPPENGLALPLPGEES